MFMTIFEVCSKKWAYNTVSLGNIFKLCIIKKMIYIYKYIYINE